MLSTLSMCISTAQAREIWVAAMSACRDCALVVVPCTFLHFVNLEVRISWQAPRFVNLQVQISWQAQRFVNLQDCVAGAALCALRCSPLALARKYIFLGTCLCFRSEKAENTEKSVESITWLGHFMSLCSRGLNQLDLTTRLPMARATHTHITPTFHTTHTCPQRHTTSAAT